MCGEVICLTRMPGSSLNASDGLMGQAFRSEDEIKGRSFSGSLSCLMGFLVFGSIDGLLNLERVSDR